MPLCEKCGKGYRVGDEPIPREINEWNEITASVDIMLTGGYGSEMVKESTYSNNDLCPKCAQKLYGILLKTIMEFLYD